MYVCNTARDILTVPVPTFRAFVLAFSVFSPKENNQHQRVRRKHSIAAKCVAVFLPVLIVGVLQIPAIKSSIPLFITIANFSWAASLTLGSALLVAILVKYIRTRRKMHRWNAHYHQHRLRDSTASAGSNSGGGGGDDDGGGARVDPEGNAIYDGWLIFRFTVALLFIEALQILTILSEIEKLSNARLENLPPEPDISAARARGDFAQFLPGVSIGVLVFLVFGTTKTCRHTIYVWIVPRRFRRRTLSIIGTHHHHHHSLTLASPESPSSLPSLYRRPSTFTTSPSPAPTPSSRGAAQQQQQPQQQQSGGRVSPYGRSLYPICEPPRAHVPRSRVAEIMERRREEHSVDSSSLHSAEAGKSGSPTDREGGGTPSVRVRAMSRN